MYAPNTKFRSALTTTVYKYAFRHILLVNVYGNRRVDIRTTIEEEERILRLSVTYLPSKVVAIRIATAKDLHIVTIKSTLYVQSWNQRQVPSMRLNDCLDNSSIRNTLQNFRTLGKFLLLVSWPTLGKVPRKRHSSLDMPKPATPFPHLHTLTYLQYRRKGIVKGCEALRTDTL